MWPGPLKFPVVSLVHGPLLDLLYTVIRFGMAGVQGVKDQDYPFYCTRDGGKSENVE